MSESVRIEWLDMPVPDDMPEHLIPGMRAGVDGNGDVWAYAGLIQSKNVALFIAAIEKEPYLSDNGNEYLRIKFMRANLVSDESCSQILNLVEDQVRRCRLH